MKKDALVILSVSVLVFLLVVALFYWDNQNLGRDPSLVGDSICSSLVSDEGQDACCYEAHKDDFTIECVGKWQYVNGLRRCQFICNESKPTCTEETRLCGNGASVVRNSSNECYFDSCP